MAQRAHAPRACHQHTPSLRICVPPLSSLLGGLHPDGQPVPPFVELGPAGGQQGVSTHRARTRHAHPPAVTFSTSEKTDAVRSAGTKQTGVGCVLIGLPPFSSTSPMRSFIYLADSNPSGGAADVAPSTRIHNRLLCKPHAVVVVRNNVCILAAPQVGLVRPHCCSYSFGVRSFVRKQQTRGISADARCAI